MSEKFLERVFLSKVEIFIKFPSLSGIGVGKKEKPKKKM